MALGAAPVRVLQLVFASAAREVIAGMGLGVMLSVFLGRFLSQWAEASSQNTVLFAAAILLLVLTAASAAYIPAHRASSVDPMIVLRYE
jgi:ABC-type antimicrobial peptide transport system permease subunit